MRINLNLDAKELLKYIDRPYDEAEVSELISEINKNNTDKFLGMKEEDYHFAMAIYGVALSSLIGFGLVRSIS